MNTTLLNTLAAFAVLVSAVPAHAQLLLESEPESPFKLNGEASSLFFWRNDTDFDSTVPYYEEEGQSVGAISTFLKPRIAYTPTDGIELFYESELGMNFWSRNDPDQYFPAADDYMVYKHREAWTKFSMDFVSLKSGYQRLSDPTHLFLDHWMGAFALEVALGNLGGRMFVGQLPDSTYEGLDARDNNFVHDNVAFGLDFSLLTLDDTLKLEAGAYGMVDHRVARKALTLFDFFMQATYTADPWKGSMGAHLQAGKWASSAVDGSDQSILAWAASAMAGYRSKYLDIALNAFALSPDDGGAGNDAWGAFFYSGKNFSRSRMLTEDELRDRYGNYDERMSARWGSFFVNRAGLLVGDLSFTGPILGNLRHEVVFAAGLTLEPDNAMGNGYAGFETTAGLSLAVAEGAEIVGVAQLFLPGKAAAVYVNEIPGSEQVLSIYGFQAGTVLKF